MATCLGIYVDQNIIKYAKVTRDKNSIKVDAFGVKLYSNLKETIDQIVSDTYSFKIPISINISEEMYNYFYMSDLLNDKDLDKAIKTEFESYCYDKGYNPNALESRYVLVNDINDKEKIRVIHVSIDKIKLNNIEARYEEQKLTTVCPISLSIANIAPINTKENIAIVNIEDTTTVTIITGQKVYDIKKIDIGAQKILESINTKENSYAKAYEICKNSTIYTMEGQELQDNQSSYLADIVPNLYQIATQVNEIVNQSLAKITKIYITGTASVINNIDLYFEELVKNVKCEILKPFFIEDSPKINIKDYIEVNSAISLALQGLDYGIKNINFTSNKSNDFFANLFSKNDNDSNKKVWKSLNAISISNSTVSKWLIGVLSISLITFLMYASLSMFIAKQIEEKKKEVAENSNFANQQMTLINNDSNNVNNKISEYATLTTKLQDATNSITEKNSYKNTIPVLLSEIMRVIPKQVQLTSIENTSEKKIVINAQSTKYEQLAYFKARLKSEGILNPNSVVSSAAAKEGDVVKIVIEGELP